MREDEGTLKLEMRYAKENVLLFYLTLLSAVDVNMHII